MFDFQRIHELEDHQHQISSYPLSPHVQSSNLFAPDHSSAAPAGGGRKKRRRPTNDDGDGGTTTNEKNIKKITHREIEKQRRQDMAKLYASLRSLLPLEYIKGKRSVSDHMHEAVNYINNLQKNISQLRSTFTKNPNLCTSSSGGNNASCESCSDRLTGNNILRSTVTINLLGNGIEILIRLNQKDHVLPISRMMRKLLSEGLNLTSYLSSKTLDDATLYCFTSEVDDSSCIDIIRLQKTLMDMIMQESTSQIAATFISKLT